MVYAKTSGKYSHDWLILISHTLCDFEGTLKIVRHASYEFSSDRLYINNSPREWGYTRNFRFYEPTEEEKRFMIDKIRENGYKYVPVLNKLIRK